MIWWVKQYFPSFKLFLESKKKTLVLDLDETLIHTLDNDDDEADMCITFKNEYKREEVLF